MRKNSILLVVALVVGTVFLATGAVTAAATDDITDLSVDVTQDDDGAGTVSVTANDSGVANASVVVETVDNDSYDGVGEYTTGENGSVGLPAPQENVTVSVTASAGNESATTETTLTATEDTPENFGQAVSSFVNSLSENETEGPRGLLVADFVLNNNPAADRIPAFAGPPEHAGPGNETGPPEHAGPGNETDSSANGATGDNGPPDHAGPGNDEEQTEEDEAGGGGPPDHAGP